MSHALPRFVVAAPASGHGKTTVATGLMAALRRTGLEVSGHKVGPDYIDPGYHALATGRPGRNLDPHLVGEERLVPLLLHGARGADVAVVEGVMGLYDGKIGGHGYASTAHVASVTRSPIVLVVDVSSASRSIGAVVRGMAEFEAGVDLVGVILNKVGSARHAAEVESSIHLPVLGVLHRDDGIVAPSRHLGLVPAQERDEAAHTLDRLTDRIAGSVDLARVLELARAAPALDGEPWDPAAEVRRWGGVISTRSATARPVVAMAGGRAFTFRYPETEELLRAAGCEVVTFDPLTDAALPPGTAALYLGGGFPEVHAADLTGNEPLRRALREAVAAGLPTVAECAGLLYLCATLDGEPMVDALDAHAAMTPRLTLRYPEVRAAADSLITRAGESVTAHEFHRTTVDPVAGALPAWVVDAEPVGFASGTLHASYLHTHWAGHPRLAQRFADAAHAYAYADGLSTDEADLDPRQVRGNPDLSGEALADTSGFPRSAGETRLPDPLRHHGDAETGAGLLDLAVNVYAGPRPDWLDAALHASLDAAGSYPTATAAEAALAARHGVAPGRVLATAGAAEAFSLVARWRDWRHAVVVHPQFTEPHAALLQAGHDVTEVHCAPGQGFALDPAAVPADADLVVVGNPTNPTGVLHPAATIRRLLRPARVVVVDEAFMDAVPGEAESLAGTDLPGLVVIRSLTKHWGIPGVRAGYLLADQASVRELRVGQVPWSVSTSAAAAMVACSTGAARAEGTRRAEELASWRGVLHEALARLGIEHVASSASFVLARVGDGTHGRLRERGIAVRRADTFPGLGPDWVRIAVRPPATTARLVTALAGRGLPSESSPRPS